MIDNYIYLHVMCYRFSTTILKITYFCLNVFQFVCSILPSSKRFAILQKYICRNVLSNIDVITKRIEMQAKFYETKV